MDASSVLQADRLPSNHCNTYYTSAYFLDLTVALFDTAQEDKAMLNMQELLLGNCCLVVELLLFFSFVCLFFRNGFFFKVRANLKSK